MTGCLRTSEQGMGVCLAGLLGLEDRVASAPAANNRTIVLMAAPLVQRSVFVNILCVACHGFFYAGVNRLWGRRSYTGVLQGEDRQQDEFR